MTIQETMDKVRGIMTQAFPNYPVKVMGSPDYEKELCVRVFAVVNSDVRKVKDFVHDLQDSFAHQHGVQLIPMVKNEAVTAQYYPQYMPSKPFDEFVRVSADYLYAMCSPYTEALRSVPVVPLNLPMMVPTISVSGQMTVLTETLTQYTKAPMSRPFAPVDVVAMVPTISIAGNLIAGEPYRGQDKVEQSAAAEDQHLALAA